MNLSQSESMVSIVIPVYNAEKNISGCLDSVLLQTYNNIEIIIYKLTILKYLKFNFVKVNLFYVYWQNVPYILCYILSKISSDFDYFYKFYVNLAFEK